MTETLKERNDRLDLLVKSEERERVIDALDSRLESIEEAIETLDCHMSDLDSSICNLNSDVQSLPQYDADDLAHEISNEMQCWTDPDCNTVQTLATAILSHVADVIELAVEQAVERHFEALRNREG